MNVPWKGNWSEPKPWISFSRHALPLGVSEKATRASDPLAGPMAMP
jgi:hypothetical protein